MSITEVLSDIQGALKAPKNQTNKFGGYNYRSCEDIMEALKPLLSAHKAAVTVSDNIVMIGDRFYIQATATLHCNGESISNTAFARESADKKGMDAAQITGATSSYARNYALNGLFCIDDTKDADATNTHGKDATEEKKAPPAPDIVGKFNETFAKLQKTPDNSIDLDSDKAKKQIEFMNDLLTALKAEGFNKNAEQLEKLFNQKLKKPEMAA